MSISFQKVSLFSAYRGGQRILLPFKRVFHIFGGVAFFADAFFKETSFVLAWFWLLLGLRAQVRD